MTETLNGEWELTLVHDIDERGKWTRLSEGCILRAPVPAAMTPSVDLVTQQYQTSTYDVQIYKITTKSGPLHLRSGSGTNYKILGKYKKGREVIVLNKTTSSWYEVTAPDGKHGYMASQYLTFQRTETQTVQTNVGFRNQVIEARQLRDQPFRIYRVVPELDKVTVYARHIFYDLLDNMLKSLKPSPSAVGASVVQSLSGACLSTLAGRFGNSEYGRSKKAGEELFFNYAKLYDSTLKDKKYAVDFISGRALREMEPAAKMYAKIVALSNAAVKGEEIPQEQQISVTDAMDVMIRWFCLLFGNQFGPDDVLDGYPVDRLMHDIALALMAVQTQTTEILSEFPTKAAKEPASPPKMAEEIPLF